MNVKEKNRSHKTEYMDNRIKKHEQNKPPRCQERQEKKREKEKRRGTPNLSRLFPFLSFFLLAFLAAWPFILLAALTVFACVRLRSFVFICG
jgi:Flp pilus assembly protein TadB